MRKTIQLTVALSIMALTSCTTTKLLTSDVKPNEIKELQRIETFSYISLIEKGNRAVYNDTLSRASAKLFATILESYKNRIPLSGSISLNDPQTRKTIEREIEYLCLTADKTRNITGLKLTPALDSLLEANQKRFGLITVTAGFTRVKGNYGGQVAKGIGLGILTLGMVTVSPRKSNSTIYAMIVDSQRNEIAFFRRTFIEDKDPFDDQILKRQIERLFEGYFWITTP